jgi:hypothetical protein
MTTPIAALPVHQDLFAFVTEDIAFFQQQGGRATFHEVAAAIKKKSDEWQKCVNLSQQMHVQLLKIFKLVGKLCIVVSLSKRTTAEEDATSGTPTTHYYFSDSGLPQTRYVIV